MEKEVTIDFSHVMEKLTANKKQLVYLTLLLILLVSAGVRLIPAKHYYLSAMDPYWHYRHANEILDHGYIGTSIKMIDGEPVYWDDMHNAPEGSIANQDAYPYFIAYSYKYFGQYFTPDLMTWDKYTPVIFGVLAILFMFLLVRDLFGERAGLAAAFIYGFSATFMTRSVAGFADTDAGIAFLTLLTFFLFIRAWDRHSYPYAIATGISIGFFSVFWPPGYWFTFALIIASAGFYLVYKFAVNYSVDKNIKNAIKRDWQKYAVVILLLIVGLLIIAILRGPESAMFWKGAIRFTEIKAAEAGSTSTVPNVLLTVAEMNPPTAREFISRIHISSLLLALTFFVLLPYGLWKKLKNRMFHLLFFSLWLVATLYASKTAMRFIEMFVVPLSIFIGIAVVELLSKIHEEKKHHVLALSAVFVVVMLFAIPNIPASPGSSQMGPPYVQTGLQIAASSGPSLNQNWLALFEWMRTETEPGDIMASWWDPGHAITALGERPAVADGGQRSEPIHDLGLIFTATDEQEAVEILDRYNVSYFFVSSDLISKYGPISFLGRGMYDGYPISYAADSKEVGGTTMISYPAPYAGQGATITLTAKDNEITPSLRIGYQTQEISRIFYFDEQGGALAISPDNNTIDALVYVSPDYQSLVFMPPELENNILTRLYFFNGYGLEHFELIENFGGEIKVYKVNY